MRKATQRACCGVAHRSGGTTTSQSRQCPHVLNLLSFSFNDCIFLRGNPVVIFDVVLYEIDNHFLVRSFIHRPHAPVKVRSDGVSDPLFKLFPAPIQVVIHLGHLLHRRLAVTSVERVAHRNPHNTCCCHVVSSHVLLHCTLLQKYYHSRPHRTLRKSAPVRLRARDCN